MNKVNVDEIKVGDLIGFDSFNKTIIGYVIRIEEEGNRKLFWGNFSNNKYSHSETYLYDHNVEYHWKVINFEEESKVDELKVYTGKETIEALLEGKVLRDKITKCDYKFKNGSLLVNLGEGYGFEDSAMKASNFITRKFTEVATPQVGDWVRVTHVGVSHTWIHTAKITKLEDDCMWADWEEESTERFYRINDNNVSWQILSPEEVSEYKREQAFVKVGRKLNEFKANDIVYIEAVNRTAIVVSSNNETEIRLHSINVGEAGHTAKPHQLTPVCFVDHMVDLSYV